MRSDAATTRTGTVWTNRPTVAWQPRATIPRRHAHRSLDVGIIFHYPPISGSTTLAFHVPKIKSEATPLELGTAPNSRATDWTAFQDEVDFGRLTCSRDAPPAGTQVGNHTFALSDPVTAYLDGAAHASSSIGTKLFWVGTGLGFREKRVVHRPSR